MPDQKNTILAIVLSALVLLGWQYFFGMPQVEKQRQQAQQQAQQQTQPTQPADGRPQPQQGAPQAPGQAPGPVAPAAPSLTREAALALSPRVRIEAPAVSGSIALKGGRI